MTLRWGYATVALPTLSLAEAAAAAAGAGFEGLECKVGEPPRARDSPARRFLADNRTTLDLDPRDGRRAARISADAGLHLIGLTPYVRTGDLETFRRVAALAQAASAPQIRLQGPRPHRGGPGYRELFDRALAFTGEAAAIAVDHGSSVVVEIHQDTIFPSASLAERLVAHFDPHRVGVIYDVGNMVVEGYEDHRIGIALLGAHLRHVHLKNARFAPDPATPGPVRVHRATWSPLDDGVVDVGAVLGHLVDAEYRGWVSLEDLSSERSPLATLQHNAAVLAALRAPGWRG
ncbi:sugar phosphate isomerase/epimerase family protein [Actinomycetospora flava]|uniref:Sugar phosphate isomerase/epimerase n=1 Tax=Actinomycetospora flava TaxID=3129232 RepID=A0ABU8M8J6_9PSEU